MDARQSRRDLRGVRVDPVGEEEIERNRATAPERDHQCEEHVNLLLKLRVILPR
jgi:hypothetical protein